MLSALRVALPRQAGTSTYAPVLGLRPFSYYQRFQPERPSEPVIKPTDPISIVKDAFEHHIERLPGKNLFRHGEQAQRLSNLRMRRHVTGVHQGYYFSDTFSHSRTVGVMPHNGENTFMQLGSIFAGITMVSVDSVPTKEALTKVLAAEGAETLVYDPHMNQSNLHKTVDSLIHLNEHWYVRTRECPKLDKVITTGFDEIDGFTRLLDFYARLPEQKYVERFARENNVKNPEWLVQYSASGEKIATYTDVDILKEAKHVVDELKLNADTSFVLSTHKVDSRQLLVANIAALLVNAQLVVPVKYPENDEDGSETKKAADAENAVGSYGDRPVEGLKQVTPL